MTHNMKKEPTIALAGCGDWGKNLARNLHGLGALYGIYDVHLETVATFSRQYSVEPLSWDDVIKNDDIKGVVIASPAPYHFELAWDALEAGKDIYVEKPITVRYDDAEILCQLAEKEQRVLMVGHLLRYHAGFLALKDLVASGVLGNVKYVYSNRLDFGKVRPGKNVLRSLAPHDVSMVLGLLGRDMPDSVDAMGSFQTSDTFEDIAHIQMSFPGGIGAHIHVSWINPFKEQKFVVMGDQGMVVFDDCQEWSKKLIHYPHIIDTETEFTSLIKADGVPLVVAQSEPLRVECEHFLQCIETRETPRTDGWEGLRVLQVLDMADKSIRAKRTVGHVSEAAPQTNKA